MLAYLVQFGTRPHAGSLWAPLLMIVGGAVIGGLLLVVLRFITERVRRRYRSWHGRRRRVRAAATAERRARAMMSELCPSGWRAEITLYSGDATTASGEPVRGAVALDWYELTPSGGDPAVMRRVWAETVGEALEAMVADRSTDETLEQIELRATADGFAWPDA